MNTTVPPSFEATAPAAVHAQKNSDAPTGGRAFASVFAVSQESRPARGAPSHAAHDPAQAADHRAAHDHASPAGSAPRTPRAATSPDAPEHAARHVAARAENDARDAHADASSDAEAAGKWTDLPAHEMASAGHEAPDAAAPPSEAATKTLLARAMQRLQMLAQAATGEGRGSKHVPVTPEAQGPAVFGPVEAAGEVHALNQDLTVDADVTGEFGDAWPTDVAPSGVDGAAAEGPHGATHAPFTDPAALAAHAQATTSDAPSFDVMPDDDLNADLNAFGELDAAPQALEAALALPLRAADGQANAAAPRAPVAGGAPHGQPAVPAQTRRRSETHASEAEGAEAAAQSAQAAQLAPSAQTASANEPLEADSAAADDAFAELDPEAPRDAQMQLDARMAAEQATDTRYAAVADNDASPRPAPSAAAARAPQAAPSVQAPKALAAPAAADAPAVRAAAPSAAPAAAPRSEADDAPALADATEAQPMPAVTTLATQIAAAQKEREHDARISDDSAAPALSAEQAMALGTARAWLEPYANAQPPAEQAASIGVEREARSTDDVLASMAWQGLMAGSAARNAEDIESSTHAERGAFAVPQEMGAVAAQAPDSDPAPLGAIGAARAANDALAVSAAAEEEEDVDALGTRSLDASQQAGSAASHVAQGDRTQNAGAVAATGPVAPAIAAHEMSEELAQSVGIGNRNIRLQVAAPGVGELAVDVRVVEGRVQMRVAGDADGLATTLRQQGEQLQASLESRGLTLESLDFRGGQAGDSLARQQGDEASRQEDRASAREAQDFERLLGPRGRPLAAQVASANATRRADTVIYVRA